MSYDLIFLRRQPGQSWDEALEALEAADSDPVALASAALDEIAGRIRQVQPEIAMYGDQLSDEELSITISCSADEADISVPYWYKGEKARAVVLRMYAYAEVVAEVTGLEGYDPQLDLSTADGIFHIHDAVDIFDNVARAFGD